MIVSNWLMITIEQQLWKMEVKMISDSVISCVEKEEKKSIKTMKNDKRKRRGRKWGDFMTKEKNDCFI